ncbi:MAG TPA: YjbQ family protein [Candidatus Parcubacteria bacterium]|nr:YjbQ family protein [Candidatus Parcubacteria bacterium]
MRFTIKTKGFTDIIDITPKIRELIRESGVEEGVCLVSCPGSTCGITTLEYEQGLVKDLKKVLDKIIPMTTDYEHCKKWGDCNGYAHVRSALINPFLSLIVKQGEPFLGAWQQVVFIDFDNRPREREIFKENR